MAAILKAPFPWFGGKSRAAPLIWERLGDVDNYVEPFFGSGAVLLGRPTPARSETVNDLDCYLSNFWRAVTAEPAAVAAAADWQVNEADLHARHLWGIPNMRLITQSNGTFPAILARVDSRYPTTGRCATGYMRRISGSRSFGGPGGHLKLNATCGCSRN